MFDSLKDLLKKRERHLAVFTKVSQSLRNLEEQFKLEIAKVETQVKTLEEKTAARKQYIEQLAKEHAATGQQAEKIEKVFQ